MSRHLLLERWQRQRNVSRILVRRHSLLRRPLFGARLRSYAAAPVSDDELVAQASPLAGLIEPVAEGAASTDAALLESNPDMPWIDSLDWLGRAPMAALVRNRVRTVAASKHARYPSFHTPLPQPPRVESAFTSPKADGRDATLRSPSPPDGISPGTIRTPAPDEKAAEKDHEMRHIAVRAEEPGPTARDGGVSDPERSESLASAPIIDSAASDRSPRAWATRLAELEMRGSDTTGGATESPSSTPGSEPGASAMRHAPLAVVAAGEGSPKAFADAAAVERGPDAAPESRHDAFDTGVTATIETEVENPRAAEVTVRHGVEERKTASGFEHFTAEALATTSPPRAVGPPAVDRRPPSGWIATRPQSDARNPAVGTTGAAAALNGHQLERTHDLLPDDAVRRLADENDRDPNRPKVEHGYVAEERAGGRIAETTDGPLPGSPVPTGHRARQLLRALVGIDSATVRVHRAPWAQRIVERRQADAVSLGSDDIAIDAASREDTPEGLGLLAHELVHVTRRRQPTFVPPVLVDHSEAQARSAAPFVRPGDEEETARIVERRVTAQAREFLGRTGRAALPPDSRSEPPGSRDALPETVSAPAVERAHEEPHHSSQARWGSLPAPWEPLPDLIRAPETVRGPTSARSAPERNEAPMRRGLAPPAEIHAAARQRRAASPSTPAEQPPAAERPAPPEQPDPDLDALARQVYGVLKRRLAAEKRRIG